MQPTDSITYPLDKILSPKEFITQKLNKWNDLLMERTLSYHEALRRYKEDPSAVVKVQHPAWPNGMPIAEIIDARIPALFEARANVATLEDMLKQEADGKLADMYQNSAIVNPKNGVAVTDPTFGAEKKGKGKK